MILSTMNLQRKIFLFGALFVTFLATVIGILFYFTISKAIETQIGSQALSIAKTTANRSDVIEAFHSSNPTKILQPIAEKIRMETNAEYVVIGNKSGIRYAHPVKDRIGHKMVGDDNERALVNGESYISEAEGTLGEAIRGKAPVLDKEGNIIGIISVGFLKKNIYSVFLEYVDNIAYIVIIAILIGIVGSNILSKNIKKVMFNLEPAEIANLLTQRNTLIESVREGIIMVDAEGKITMINSAASDTLSISAETSLIGRSINEIIPNSQLLDILVTGDKQLDRPMHILGKQTIVNRIPIRIGDKIVGAVSSFRLQSEIDQLAIELSQVKQYTEALRSQTHEYKNFLYTISGLIQLHSYDEALELIHEETEEHQSLIKIITTKLNDPYICGIIIGFYNRAKELKIRFILDEDSNLSKLPKHLDKYHFVSIIGNLITNAFEAVERLPEKERIVRFLIFENGTEIVMEVEDSGDGIPENILNSLFKQRISTKAKENRGYGLTKVSEILMELNGSVYLEKGDLNGALFITSVPLGGISHE
ncbi:ATP-binding protein [Rummeliibacillus pycnus]|uniref:ATP-binding protein n=1 Tax=Rummeliibacillus pycnus TaxID=101070 RepID=UPI003D29C838